MKELDSPNERKETSSLGIGGLLAILLLMLAVMIGSIYYPFPDGKHLDFWGFVSLWAREIIIVGFFVLVAIVFAAAWLLRLIREKTKGTGNAL